MKRFENAVAHARQRGRVVTGGDVIGKSASGAAGHYLAPTVVADLPVDDDLFRDELFVPFVAVAPVDSIDEALSLANDTELGLTAGFFSADNAEVDEFLNRIEAGVVYVNRAAGATTGAWPGVQPSVAGRVLEHRARPEAVCTTSSNSCASSPERWWRSDSRRHERKRAVTWFSTDRRCRAPPRQAIYVPPRTKRRSASCRASTKFSQVG